MLTMDKLKGTFQNCRLNHESSQQDEKTVESKVDLTKTDL